MKLADFCSSLTVHLMPEQRARFRAYIPGKVYHTERNIALVVAATQLCMILFFVFRGFPFHSWRSVAYFCLYIYLFVATVAAFFLYRHTVKNKKFKTFLWLRRIYTVLLCLWVVSISFLEQAKGGSFTVYCYLLPTTAAMLLLTPLESTVIFGGTWASLVVMLLTMGNRANGIFGDMVNSSFVTILSLFISFRYYRSTAVEFCDRELIAQQYEEIKAANGLLEGLVHIDQLTGLNNRHYLHEMVAPLFIRCREQHLSGMCLMMDIDYFKQYNDLYGHLQGDECLKKIADATQELCREERASPIRYGGEEFLIIKLTADDFDADAFAGKLLKRIADTHIVRTDVAQKHVTVSAGLWFGKLDSLERMEQAIQYADDALYRAKSQGRDRTVCWNR